TNKKDKIILNLCNHTFFHHLIDKTSIKCLTQVELLRMSKFNKIFFADYFLKTLDNKLFKLKLQLMPFFVGKTKVCLLVYLSNKPVLNGENEKYDESIEFFEHFWYKMIIHIALRKSFNWHYIDFNAAMWFIVMKTILIVISNKGNSIISLTSFKIFKNIIFTCSFTTFFLKFIDPKKQKQSLKNFFDVINNILFKIRKQRFLKNYVLNVYVNKSDKFFNNGTIETHSIINLLFKKTNVQFLDMLILMFDI
ncbi:hypothetical protein RFI_01660, partial [Reticulomyxa filosa]